MARGDRSYMKINMLSLLPEVPDSLMTQPGFGTGFESHFEPDSHLWADSHPAVDDSGKGFTAYAKQAGSLGNCKPKWFEEIFSQHITWMRRIVHCAHISTSLMVVLVIYKLHIPSRKAERNTPVCLNDDSPDTFTITAKGMESEARNVQVIRTFCNIKPDKNTPKLFCMSSLYPGLAASPLWRKLLIIWNFNQINDKRKDPCHCQPIK